jgi:hypothetical protein
LIFERIWLLWSSCLRILCLGILRGQARVVGGFASEFPHNRRNQRADECILDRRQSVSVGGLAPRLWSPCPLGQRDRGQRGIYIPLLSSPTLQGRVPLCPGQFVPHEALRSTRAIRLTPSLPATEMNIDWMCQFHGPWRLIASNRRRGVAHHAYVSAPTTIGDCAPGAIGSRAVDADFINVQAMSAARCRPARTEPCG